MSILWLTNTVPQNSDKARATTANLSDSEPAELDHAPEYNEHNGDTNPDLPGIANRQLAGDWHNPERGSAFYASNASAQHNESVNAQVASSGNAANSETRGDKGPGTVAYALSLEPVIRDGARYGSDYFAVEEHDPQSMVGVQPNMQLDRQEIASVGAEAASRSNSANNNVSDLYAAYVRGLT